MLEYYQPTTTNPMNPEDVPSVTCVGGTELLRDGSAAWTGEFVWPQGGGGNSLRYPMPSYQSSGIDWSAIPGASLTMRNCPALCCHAPAIHPRPSPKWSPCPGQLGDARKDQKLVHGGGDPGLQTH